MQGHIDPRRQSLRRSPVIRRVPRWRSDEAQQLDCHRVFAQDRLASQARLGANTDERVELLVLEPLNFRQTLAPFLHEEVAGPALGLALALVSDVFADSEQRLQHTGAGNDVIGLTRRQYGECSHGEYLVKL